jgi:hypothetical protein
VTAAKLVLTWDIQTGKEREFVEFYVSEFGPGLQRLGVTITEHWYTQAGAGPQVILGGTVASPEAARALINGAEFTRMRDRLFEYVENFRWRIARPHSGGFQP